MGRIWSHGGGESCEKSRDRPWDSVVGCRSPDVFHAGARSWAWARVPLRGTVGHAGVSGFFSRPDVFHGLGDVGVGTVDRMPQSCAALRTKPCWPAVWFTVDRITVVRITAVPIRPSCSQPSGARLSGSGRYVALTPHEGAD